MSIDAIIVAVEPHEDGARLRLADPPGRCSGQSSLVVVNPPPTGLDAVIGMHIWGGSDQIMIRDRKWADRIGYTRIRLCEAPAAGERGGG